MAPRLSQVKRAELADKAVELSARGLSNLAIASDIGVNRHTVKKLIDDELASRAEHRANDKERHLAVYTVVQRAAWERFKNTDNRSINASGYLNTIRGAEDSKVKLTGAAPPQKLELALEKEMENVLALMEDGLSPETFRDVMAILASEGSSSAV